MNKPKNGSIKKKSKYIKYKKKVSVRLKGPILLTSPHGLQIYRGGSIVNEKLRIHSRERYTTQICLKLSKFFHEEISGDSFIIWNESVAKPKDKSNLDPNYLIEKQFKQSVWNESLTKFKENLKVIGIDKIIHFDVHGKMKRKNGLIKLDIGMMPLEELWDNQEDVKKLKIILVNEIKECFNKINKKRKLKNLKRFEYEEDPRLHGFWGNNTVTTMSHQSVLKGILGIQFEMPPEIRKELVFNDEFLKSFGKALLNCYYKFFDVKKEDINKILKEANNGAIVNYKEYLAMVSEVDKKILKF